MHWSKRLIILFCTHVSFIEFNRYTFVILYIIINTYIGINLTRITVILEKLYFSFIAIVNFILNKYIRVKYKHMTIITN
jgi:hypothetical protein